jgi:hypothetical protein
MNDAGKQSSTLHKGWHRTKQAAPTMGRTKNRHGRQKEAE